MQKKKKKDVLSLNPTTNCLWRCKMGGSHYEDPTGNQVNKSNIIIPLPTVSTFSFIHSLSVETPLVCGVPWGSMYFNFSLHQTVGGTHSKVLHRLPPFFADDSELYSCLPTEHESALRAIGNVEPCCHDIKRWMMKNKLKVIINELKTEVLLSGTALLEGECPCWQPFGWRSVLFFLHFCENHWSNFGHYSFFWSTRPSRRQVVASFMSDLWAKFVHTSLQNRKQYCCLTNSVKAGLL